MSNRRLLILVLLVVLVSQVRVGAGELGGELEGEQRLSKRVGDAVVSVIARIRDGRHCSNADGWMWGSEQECPRKMIATLTVTMNKKVIFVPASAYGDLGNVRSITIKPTRNGFDVGFAGGDAATSYRSTLRFERGATVDSTVLRSRIVRSGEFPDKAWEETRYHFNMSDEVEPPIR
jgi:hypothetical protein